MQYSIPFNGESNWGERIDFALGDWASIHSVYFSANPSITQESDSRSIGHSSRGGSSSDTARIDETISDLIATMHANRVPTILRLDGRQDLDGAIEYIERIYHEDGLHGIAVESLDALSGLAPKTRWPALKVHSLVEHDKDSLDGAARLIDAGADELTVPMEFNRRIDELRAWKRALSVSLKLKVNAVSPKSFRVLNQGHSIALDKTVEKLMKQSWIRPEETSAYDDVVDVFEIAGESDESSRLAAVVAAYRSQRFSGDLRELLELDLDCQLSTKCLTNEQWQHRAWCHDGDCEDCVAAADALARGKEAIVKAVVFTEFDFRLLDPTGETYDGDRPDTEEN